MTRINILNEYALEKKEGGAWDYYPDPLRATEEEVLTKIAYLSSRFGVGEYRCRKLSLEEQQEHHKQWTAWCKAID